MVLLRSDEAGLHGAADIDDDGRRRRKPHREGSKLAKIENMWLTPGPMPNGLQAVGDGLWVIDQADNHLYKLDYEDGSVLSDMPTETWKSSGVTEGGGYVWIASTHNYRIYKLADDGSTVDFYDPPTGERDPSAVGPDTIRPHGMEWVDDKLWVSVKPANRNYLMDPGTMEVLHSIETPGPSPHGLAWDGEGLWCADREMGVVHRQDPETGEVMDEVSVPDPELHGLTYHEGALLVCCATTRRVVRVTL